MIKHVARHDQKKAVILFKKVPNEEHMALIVYPDSLPDLYHKTVMKTLESEVGQGANDFGEPLGRAILGDGRNALEVLHKEGYIRKVPTNQVIVTPTINTTIRLDELNEYIDQLAQGEEAAKKLKELDESMGLNQYQNLKSSDETQVKDQTTDLIQDANDALANDVAMEKLQHATKLESEANALLAEAERIREEVAQMLPETKAVAEPKATTKKRAKAAPKARAKAKAKAAPKARAKAKATK